VVVEHLRRLEKLLREPQRAAGITGQEHALGDVGVGTQMHGTRHAHSD
jgi:hypothetical protein